MKRAVDVLMLLASICLIAGLVTHWLCNIADKARETKYNEYNDDTK